MLGYLIHRQDVQPKKHQKVDKSNARIGMSRLMGSVLLIVDLSKLLVLALDAHRPFSYDFPSCFQFE